MNEKTVVFAPVIIFFVFFIIIVIVFFTVLIKLLLKGKKDAWVGELVDKTHTTYQDMDTDEDKHLYTLIFKTDTGRQVKYGTSKLIYSVLRCSQVLILGQDKKRMIKTLLLFNN